MRYTWRESDANATNRRQFLSLTTSAAASTWAGARLFAAGASASPGPNGTINLGIIGCRHRRRELLPCFSAHVDKDPGSLEPECLYYYKWDKAARRFTRHTISAPGQGVGMGMQICVADLNADGRPDIVVAGKTGTWLLLNQ